LEGQFQNSAAQELRLGDDFSHNPRQRPTFSSPPHARIEALGFKDVSQQGYRDKIDLEDLSDDVDWRSKMNSVFLGFMEQYYWFIFVISVVNTFCGV